MLLTSRLGAGPLALATTMDTVLPSFIAAITGSSGELSTNFPLICEKKEVIWISVSEAREKLV